MRRYLGQGHTEGGKLEKVSPLCLNPGVGPSWDHLLARQLLSRVSTRARIRSGGSYFSYGVMGYPFTSLKAYIRWGLQARERTFWTWQKQTLITSNILFPPS